MKYVYSDVCCCVDISLEAWKIYVHKCPLISRYVIKWKINLPSSHKCLLLRVKPEVRTLINLSNRLSSLSETYR